MRNIFCTLVWIYCAVLGYGQDYLYDQYTEVDGLLDSEVYSCVQDAAGYLWFATASGVSRFDGRTFTNFTTDDGLTDNDVIGIYGDSKGRIWFETFSGVPCFYYDNQIYNPSNLKMLQHVQFEYFINSTYEDRAGNIWIGSKQDVYKLCFEDSTVVWHEGIKAHNFWEYQDTVYSFSAYWNEHCNLISGQIFGFKDYPNNINAYSADFIDKYSETEIIVHREKDLFLYNLQNEQWTPFTHFNEVNQAKIIKPVVAEDYIFVPTLRGCYRFHKSDPNKLELYLKNVDVRNVLVDHEKNSWFCTNQGVFLFRNRNIINVLNDEKNYRTISAGQEELMASDVNGRLIRYNPTKTPSFFSIDLPQVIRLSYYDKEQYSFGSDFGIYRVKDDQLIMSMERSSIKALVIRNDTAFLFLSTSLVAIPAYSTLETTDNLNELIGSKRAFIRETDRSFSAAKIEGQILVGMKTGLYKFTGSEFLPLVSAAAIQHDRITAILKNKSHYYIGTFASGLYKTDLDFGHLSQVENAPNRVIKLLNKDGQLILIGRNNLFAIQEKQLIKLPALDNQVVTLHDATVFENRLHLATSNGVWRIEDPTESPDLPQPIISLNILDLNGNRLKKNTTYSRDLIFEFNAVTFSKRPLRYEYKLDNDDFWTLTQEPFFRHANLSPRRYQLQLRIRDQNNQLIAQDEIGFEILPNFWETILFKISALFCVLLLLAISVRKILQRSKRKLETRHEIEMRLIEAEASALRAQMNPHFIFNALNSIQNLVVQERTTSAYKYLGAFSNLVRLILKNSRSRHTSIQEELKFLKTYLELESLRFSNQFSYTIELEEQALMTATIPSMIIQPFVENAIVHGLISVTGKKPTLSICFKIEGDRLKCIIEDNGVGRNFHDNNKRTDTKESLAIKMINERFEVLNLNGQASGFEIIDLYKYEKPAGTRVIVTLNYEGNNH